MYKKFADGIPEYHRMIFIRLPEGRKRVCSEKVLNWLGQYRNKKELRDFLELEWKYERKQNGITKEKRN